MRIGIDTSPLYNGNKERGVGVYTDLLVSSLQEYENKHEYVFFQQGQHVPRDVDIVHYPYFDPFFLTLPWIKHTPTVVTVHDLIPLVFPDQFPRGIRGSVKWYMQLLSLRLVRRIAADSQQTKRDIVRLTGFLADGIDVVPLAQRAKFKKIENKREIQRITQQYHLDAPYFLYVGDVNWSKNVEGLFRAFQLVLQNHQEKKQRTVKLLCVGSAFLNERLPEVQNLRSTARTLGIFDAIQFVGHIPDADLLGLYSLAAGYIQSSWYEGFGFPVLEAMACGCPVIAANSSSLPEISGPSLLVDPSDADQMASAMITVLSYTPKERAALAMENLIWAGKFTWKRVAHEMIQVYEKALETV